jgi:alkylation response protein AidB-like acyl-CoA dehydrogenase
MNATPAVSDTTASPVSLPLPDFLANYRETLQRMFHRRADIDAMGLQRGFPGFVMREIFACDPLSVFIPKEYGGRGNTVCEGQSVLEASSYESLALSLTVGINGALFLQPVAKYAEESVKPAVFERFLHQKALGGLMITEPDYGSDALNMKTSYVERDDHYHLEGTKHWAGLTGWADYWLVTARQRDAGGDLARDIDFFIVDENDAEQQIAVEEFYENLGLYMIRYGRNRVDARVPKAHRLVPHSTGIKMMLDLLHRSRTQFPGMGMGFIKRMLDEALGHCRERLVGNQPLFDYDQVRARIARLQAEYTAVSAMCLYASENAGIEHDLSKASVPANAIKTVCTDMMQSAAQSVVQLLGGKGYTLDNVAGRGIVDSRPFQIFEGSNDILYQQVTEAVVKGMRRMKETNLYQYLKKDDLTARAADYFKDTLDFDIDMQMPQRKLVELGQALSRIVSMDLTIELGTRGFRGDLVSNALTVLKQDVEAIVTTYRSSRLAEVVEGYKEDAGWLSFVAPKTA